MSYYSALASALRTQRLGEKKVTEVLREVRDAESASGQPAEQLFGPPVDYAKQYPRGGTVSAGVRVMNVGGVVAALWVALSLFGGLDLLLRQTMLVALAIVLVAVITGALLDRRVPAPARPRVS